MNKRTLHRPLALLLALAMTLTLFTVPALAADEDSTGGNPVSYVKVDGQTLNENNATIPGASFNAQTSTLTLTNYTGGGISASNGDLTIVVSGTNRVNEPNDWGIQVWHGSLTIQGATSGKTTDTLTIHSSNSALLAYNGDLTVKNLANLNCSSTTSSNPIISGRGGGMTFENIGTMLVRGNTSYSAIFEASGKYPGINFEGIDAVEILNDGSCGITAHYGLNIENCGTVLAVSKQKAALDIYSQGAKIQADRLIAVGNIGIDSYLNNAPGRSVDLSNVTTMLIAGQTRAIDGSVQLPNGMTYNKNDKRINSASSEWTLTTITLSNTSQNYTGQPIEITATANPTENSMIYIYSWYKEDGTTPLMEAPTDVGTYKVKVYGFSKRYYSDFNAEEQTVTITAADHNNEQRSGTIGKGNNVFDLPAIPDKMHYGTPKVTVPTTGSGETDSAASNAAATSRVTASIGGNKLNVKAEITLGNDEKYTVTIPVEPDTGANYNEYDIVYTLTAQVNSYRFDLCDGSDVKVVETTAAGSTPTLPNTTLYKKTTNEDGAWEKDIATAEEFGYTFAGWYTAPNGWGQPAGNTYTPGTTYFAKWVATRAVAGYANVPGKDDPQLAYVQFADGQCRTVYTTGLDFTQAATLEAAGHISGDGYGWNKDNNTLTLTGVLVNSGTSSTALTLPGGANVVLEKDTRMTGANTYYIEKNQEMVAVPATTIPEGANATAYNNFCGGGGEIPSMQVGQEEETTEEGVPETEALTAETPKQFGLTISAKDPGCAFSVRGGVATVVGSLTLKPNTTLSTQGIDVLGSVTIPKTSMLATVDTNKVQTRALDLFVSGDLTGEGMLLVDGDITSESKIELTNGAMLMTWGALQANEINLSQLDPNSACDSLQSLEKITLDNTALELDGEVGFFAVEAEDLTITNGSELTVKDYPLCGIAASGDMVVSNSTVKIENESEEGLAALALIDSPSAENNKKATLNLQRARMTAPSGVSMTKFDEEMQIAMVGEKAAQTLTIEPYTPSSSGSSNYTVKVNETKNGTVTPSATRVGSGSTVTLTVDPDGGYVLDSITAKDAAGKDVSLTKTADGKYTFKMPSSAVTVNASFRLRFTDVDPNAWYFKGVQESVKKGLMEGMSETIFAPNGTLTRAQLVTILWRMEQQPSVNYALPFTDVAEGQWYTEAVRWAASTNVVNGTSATTFTPDAPVTREQLVAMLWRYAKQKGYDVSIGEETNILSYPDATTVSEYAIPAMQWACGSGIIQGADGKLLPRESTTRAQIATIFQRFGALKA